MANTGTLISANIELDEFLNSIPVGRRKPRFRALAMGMLSAKRPICIVETGCMRQNEMPEQDGCSTLVWDFVAQKTGGVCFTIDLDHKAIEYVKLNLSPSTQAFCMESVRFLAEISDIIQPIDFLYLDSMDWRDPNKRLSELHHAAELSAAWKWLGHDALIAIDDCEGPYEGKHALVKRWFDSIGNPPLVADYIHVWRKPAPQEGIKLVPSE